MRSTATNEVLRPLVGHPLELFYDSDCGLCTRGMRLLRRLDGGHRLRLTPLQNGSEMTPGAPPLEVLLGTMHVRDGTGVWSAGGAAWVQIARAVPMLKPLGVLAVQPILRRMVEPTYSLVAANRHRISRLLGIGTCQVGRHFVAGPRR